jgi:WD40 repeat protein
LATLIAHTGAVKDATFGPDNKRVLTASSDGAAMVWNLAEYSGDNVFSIICRAVKGNTDFGGKEFSRFTTDQSICTEDIPFPEVKKLSALPNERR